MYTECLNTEIDCFCALIAEMFILSCYVSEAPSLPCTQSIFTLP
jgi:hypothetical protein